MSHLWPHPSYAESQPHSHLILTTHVLLRGFQTGTFLAPLLSLPRYILLRRRAPPATLTRPPPLLPYLLRATGTGAMVGTGLVAIGLAVRMQGRESIEWQDRAWRLLENRGQVEVDGWSGVGMGVGGGVWGVMRVRTAMGRGMGMQGMKWGWRMGVGSVGIGGTVGVLGYLGWRYGVKGGRWEDDGGEV